ARTTTTSSSRGCSRSRRTRTPGRSGRESAGPSARPPRTSERPAMKLGILADIHEATGNLRAALAALRERGAERFVVLGDVFETGKDTVETVRLLQEAGAVGVWGNHDLGLSHEPTESVRAKYAGPGGQRVTRAANRGPRAETAHKGYTSAVSSRGYPECW